VVPRTLLLPLILHYNIYDKFYNILKYYCIIMIVSSMLDMLLFGLLTSTNFKMGSRKRESVCVRVCVCEREREND
jgi:hypothetical protein